MASIPTAGASQEGRTSAKNISETPRNQSKGSTGDGKRGYEAGIKFSVKKPRE